MLAMMIVSLLLGIISGVLSGLFGLGGGLIIVPVLLTLFSTQTFIPVEQQMIFAIATSLATIIFTSMASIVAHQQQKNILWVKVRRLLPGILMGAVLGTFVADKISHDSLRLFFMSYLLYSALKMALSLKLKLRAIQHYKWLDYIAGAVIGLLSSILGIGGGSLTVPYLANTQIPMKNAVAISSTCGLPIACSATVSYILLGLSQPNLPDWSLGYVYLPPFLGIVVCSIFTAPIGARLANQVAAHTLKRYFSLILLIMALKMLII
ncbi:MAG: sulfite exporter TauE/SafE family protein [Methylococcales bacterium]|nr:sulfite exporter TauE/SafE family protein [Methylococcales bacterium]